MMRRMTLLLLSFFNVSHGAFAAEYYAKPTVSIQLQIKNTSNFYYGSSSGQMILFSENLEGKVSTNGKTLIQPEDAVVEYQLNPRYDYKVCILTIKTINGNAKASIKNLSTWDHCSIKGDPNGSNFNFIID